MDEMPMYSPVRTYYIAVNDKVKKTFTLTDLALGHIVKYDRYDDMRQGMRDHLATGSKYNAYHDIQNETETYSNLPMDKKFARVVYNKYKLEMTVDEYINGEHISNSCEITPYKDYLKYVRDNGLEMYCDNRDLVIYSTPLSIK